MTFGIIRALDPAYYTDGAVFAREQERIFFRTWLYACHVSELESPGDYVSFEICGQNLFAIRCKDGALRAFYNVCMHRAHELLEGRGNKRQIVCPYHAWSYGPNGRFRKAPNHEKVPGFDGSQICLTEVRTEVFCGFVFVNLGPEARPMAEWFPGVAAELSDFLPEIARLAPVVWIPVEKACNWKVSVENYNECYHCRLNHPTFAKGVIDPASYNVMPQGHCLRHTTRAASPEKMSYAAAGASAGDYSSWFLWPGFSFQVYPGGVLNTYAWQPTGVITTTVYRGWYGPEGKISEAIDRLAAQDQETTVAEDIRLVNSVQRGLASRGYRPAPLILDPDLGVNSEHSLRALHEWLLEALCEQV